MSKDRPRFVLVLAVVASALIALEVSEEPAFASAQSISVSDTQSGRSTCTHGAFFGTGGFDVEDLKDAGASTFEVWTGMQRIETEDSDGVYGEPTIAEIKADPDVVNWDWWDDAMTTAPPGWPASHEEMFSDLNDAGIAPMAILRNAGPGGVPSWAPNPPVTADDWNEWWEYVFAVAYWFNVLNDIEVDQYYAHAEPNRPNQGWAGTQAQYFELVEYTNDALDHVYSTYLPGREYHLHAPYVAEASGLDWVEDALEEIPDEFTHVSFSDFLPSVAAGTQEIRGWMEEANTDKELWLSSYGMGSSIGDDQYQAMRRGLANMIRGSRAESRLDGMVIFKMYATPGQSNGLIGSNGDRFVGYYQYRMGVRALQGCKPTLVTTSSDLNLMTLALEEPDGSLSLIALNHSQSTPFEVDIDFSDVLTDGTATMWKVDGIHSDEIVDTPSITDGQLSVDIGPATAILLKVVGQRHVATADAYVRDGDDDDTNFGTASQLHFKQHPQTGVNRWSYLKFDLSGVDADDVGHVNLRLFGGQQSSNPNEYTDIDTEVYSVATTSWSETGITWNNKPATSGTALDSFTVPEACVVETGGTDNPCWLNFDVTDYIKTQLAAEETTISLALKYPSEFYPVMKVDSREASGDDHPHLQIFTQPSEHVATADAYVRDGDDDDTNFGTASQLHFKQHPQTGVNRWSYLKFDLSGVDADDVGHVNLRLFGGQQSSNPNEYTDIDTEVYSVATTSWSETGITWNNKPATSGTALDSFTVPEACVVETGGTDNPCWLNFDVTDYIKTQLAAEETTISLALKYPSEFYPVMKVDSREASGDDRPHLQIFTQPDS